MPALWRTVYAAHGARSAHRLILASAGLAVFLAFSWLATGLTPWLGGTVLVFLLVMAVRRAGVRVSTDSRGVTVTNTWRTHFVPWELVQEIVVMYKPYVLRDAHGYPFPPEEEWEKVVRNDKTLLLFDMVEGPHKIKAIGLSLPGDTMLMVEAVHRDALDVLSEARRHYQRSVDLW